MPKWMTRWHSLSSPSTRFLPRRATLRTLWPSSSARKSLADLWRRTARPLVTETILNFLPTRSRDSDTRTVSTSASSGTVVLLPGRARSLALRALLRASFAHRHQVAHANRGHVRGRVRGSVRDDLVVRGAQSSGLGPLTKAGLWIDVAGFQRCFGDVACERLVHELLRDVVSPLEVEGGHNRFEGVGEQRGSLGGEFLLYPAPHTHDRTEVEVARGSCKGRFVHDPAAHQRARSLVEFGVSGNDEVGDREVHDGVTQKLESLVGLNVVFGRVARMSQGREEERTRGVETQARGDGVAGASHEAYAPLDNLKFEGDVVDGVADRGQSFKVFVVNAKAGRVGGEVVLKGLNQFDKRKRVRAQVGEADILRNVVRALFEDLGQLVAN